MLITDTGGAVTGTYTYDPYGKATHTLTATTTLQFNGQYADAESGLIYLRARYYDPTCGQFLSVDAMVETRSRYGYASNNPLTFDDPSGEFSLGWLKNAVSYLGSHTWGLRKRDTGSGCNAYRQRMYPERKWKATLTLTAGRATGVPQVNGSVGFFTSNAATPKQLEGWFGSGGGSLGQPIS